MSVACADRITATSSSNGVLYSSSVVGFGLSDLQAREDRGDFLLVHERRWRIQLRAASSSPNEMNAPGGSIASRNPMSTRKTLVSAQPRPRAEQSAGVVQQRAAPDELASDAER